MVSGINVFNAQKTEALSDVALANVEALAEGESDLSQAVWNLKIIHWIMEHRQQIVGKVVILIVFYDSWFV